MGYKEGTYKGECMLIRSILADGREWHIRKGTYKGVCMLIPFIRVFAQRLLIRSACLQITSVLIFSID